MMHLMRQNRSQSRKLYKRYQRTFHKSCHYRLCPILAENIIKEIKNQGTNIIFLQQLPTIFNKQAQRDATTKQRAKRRQSNTRVSTTKVEKNKQLEVDSSSDENRCITHSSLMLDSGAEVSVIFLNLQNCKSATTKKHYYLMV